MKESYPVELSNFAVKKGIDKEAAFRWWVLYVLKKAKAIVSAIKARVTQKIHKFGVEALRTVADTTRLDKENGNTM